MLREKPRLSSHSGDRTKSQPHALQQRLQSSSAHSRLFKKLSMSFYNWATKNNDKQVVCQSYDEPFSEEAYHSLSHRKPPKETRKKKAKMIKKKPQKPIEQPLARSDNFNEYYFQGITNVPSRKTTKDTHPHQQSSYMLSRVPREVTQFYFRRYLDDGTGTGLHSPTQHSVSAQRSQKSKRKQKSNSKSKKSVKKKK